MGAKRNKEAPRSMLAAEGRLRERWPCISLGQDLMTTDPEQLKYSELSLTALLLLRFALKPPRSLLDPAVVTLEED